MSIELKPREWLLALWANGTFTVEAEDAPCWQSPAPPAQIRAVAALPMEATVKDLRAALDAERAEHKLTEAAASAEAQRHDELLAEVRALKERLKRAEAVCEFMEARDLRMNDALAAWRAGK